jgi:hypothetical protein
VVGVDEAIALFVLTDGGGQGSPQRNFAKKWR